MIEETVMNQSGEQIVAYDDSGGAGPVVILLPGAGDVRSEHRFLEPALTEAGFRVITADLPGHGESPIAESYGVEQAGRSLLDLIDHVGVHPVAVVGCSFAPAAAVWAAAERPDVISKIVMLSPHVEEDHSIKSRAIALMLKALLRGPWAAGLWAGQYRSWYPGNPPADLDGQVVRLRAMVSDPARRRAVRDTLVADRDGLTERLSRLIPPVLVVFGGSDNHFADPREEAKRISALAGEVETLIVEGAGHYPHVERPEIVGPAVVDFLLS